MPKVLKKAAAFIIKDLRIESSYRINVAMQIFGIFFTILTFFFLGKLVDSSAISMMQHFRGGYFSFVLTGIALVNYFSVATRSFAAKLREAQLTGTLEAMLMTPTPVGQIIIFSTLYDFVLASVRVVLYMAIGILFFGMDVSAAKWGWAFLFLILSISMFSSIGIISASFIMIFKRGDPISMALGAASFLFSGVYYPVEVLPPWLRIISDALPMTWALKGMRQALIPNQTSCGLGMEFIVVSGFTVVLWPLSLLVFNQAVKKARKDGSIGKY